MKNVHETEREKCLGGVRRRITDRDQLNQEREK